MREHILRTPKETSERLAKAQKRQQRADKKAERLAREKEAEKRVADAATCRERWGGPLSPVDAKRLHRAWSDARRDYILSEREERANSHVGNSGLDYTLRDRLLTRWCAQEIFSEYGLRLPDNGFGVGMRDNVHEAKWLAQAIRARLKVYPTKHRK